MAWSNSVAITIDHTKVPNTDQTNFPFLFTGAYKELATVANGGYVQNANGYDIIFASDSAGASPLSFERVAYVARSGGIEAWVKIPTLSHTADTVIYILFGNSAITSAQASPPSVWDANYKAVYHFGAPSLLGLTDSTSDALTLSVNGSVSAANGKFAGSVSLPGGANYVYSAPNAAFNDSDYTIEAWCNFASFTNPAVLSHVPTAGTAGHYYMYVSASSHLVLDIPYVVGSVLTCSTALSVGTWYKLVITKSGSSFVGYVNGVSDGTATNSTAATLAGQFSIGAVPSANLYASALFDEVRVSSIPRSADWIAAEYANQNSPSTFYSASLTPQTGLYASTPFGPFPTAPNNAAPIANAGSGANHQKIKGPSASSQAVSSTGSGNYGFVG